MAWNPVITYSGLSPGNQADILNVTSVNTIMAIRILNPVVRPRYYYGELVWYSTLTYSGITAVTELKSIAVWSPTLTWILNNAFAEGKISFYCPLRGRTTNFTGLLLT